MVKNKIKVYTKTGDYGTTIKYNDVKIPKDDEIIITGGKIDFVQAAIDSSKILLLNKKYEEIKRILEKIQDKLWQTSAEISLGGKGKNIKMPIEEQDILELEEQIDKYNQKIDFFIRFTKETSTRLNEVRVRFRDLEICLTPLLREQKIRSEIYRYINRVSDLIYVLACYIENN